MRFKVRREALGDAVAFVSRALPTRPVVPVLSGMLLDAGPDGLTLSCFDYEVSARVRVEAEVIEPGSALVPGRLLAEITRSLPARPAEFADEPGIVNLTCGSAEFGLVCLSEQDYPALPDSPEPIGVIDGGVLAAAIAQVAPAASRDDTLPMLTAVCLDVNGSVLTLVATDRYRMAARELTFNPASQETRALALVPARIMTEAARTMVAGQPVAIAFGGDPARQRTGPGGVSPWGGGPTPAGGARAPASAGPANAGATGAAAGAGATGAESGSQGAGAGTSGAAPGPAGEAGTTGADPELAGARPGTVSAGPRSAGAGARAASTQPGPADGLISFETGDRRLTARLIAGDFIKYRARFPDEYGCHAVIPAASVIEAVRRAALVAERAGPVRLTFEPGQVVIEAHAEGRARAVEKVAAEFAGEQPAISFNPHYLLDGLTAASTMARSASGSGGAAKAASGGGGAGEPDADRAERAVGRDASEHLGKIRLEFTSPAKPALITCVGDIGLDAAPDGGGSRPNGDNTGPDGGDSGRDGGDSGGDGQAGYPAFRYLLVPLRMPVRT